MAIPNVDQNLQAAAVKIAEIRKCGAVVRENGFHSVKLCCDPTLAITIYPVDTCECLRRARERTPNEPYWTGHIE